MRPRAVLTADGASAIVALPAPASACACGVAPQARIDVEHALVVLRDGREDLVISYDLRAAGKRPAVVLPVPREPKDSAVEGPDPFAYLQRVTAPPPTAAAGGGEGARGPAAGASPTIKRSVVGGYSVTRLHGGSGAMLDRWLHRNGYALPARAPAILHRYAKRGWWFVALRLAKRADGALEPLRLRFATSRAVYPMRLAQLGTRPVELDLYAVGDGELVAAPLAATFSATVKDLREAPPSSLAALLDPGATLTKLQADGVAPAAFRDDIWLRAATTPTQHSEAAIFAALVSVVARLA
jgi:hypothetical protein